MDWLNEGSSQPAKVVPIDTKGDTVKESCPYCKKKYKNLDRHLPGCKNNPENKITIDIQEDLSKLKKALKKHYDNLWDGIYYRLSAWRKRYLDRKKRHKKDPVIRDYESFEKTFNWLEELKEVLEKEDD